MKIGKKLFLSITFICLFIVVSAIITTFYTIHINNKLSKVTEVTNPAGENINEMISILWRSNYIIQKFSIETNTENLDSLEFEFKHLNRLFRDNNLAVINTIDNEIIENKVSQAEKNQETFYAFSLKLMEKQRQEITEKKPKKEEELFMIQYSILKQLEKDVVDAVELLDEASIELEGIINQANKESHDAVKNAIITTIIITLLGLISAAAIWSILTKSITEPISSLSGAASKLSKGNFDIDVKVEDTESEFSDLAKTFNQMVSSLRTIIEESPRLKKFIKIKSKNEKEPKYIVEKRTSYLIKDPSSLEAYEVLLDSITKGWKPLFITRNNPETIKEKYGIEKTNVIWLSEEKEKGITSTSELKQLKKLIFDFISKNEKPIMLLDRIDYLMNIHGFDEIYTFIIEINDKIMTKDSIFLLPIDPTIFTNKQLALLEKELNKPPQQALTMKISEELKRILEFISNRKSINKPATYKDIGQKFSITAPTTQKKINELNAMGLIRISKIGRNKVLDLTRDGERILANK